MKNWYLRCFLCVHLGCVIASSFLLGSPPYPSHVMGATSHSSSPESGLSFFLAKLLKAPNKKLTSQQNKLHNFFKGKSLTSQLHFSAPLFWQNLRLERLLRATLDKDPRSNEIEKPVVYDLRQYKPCISLGFRVGGCINLGFRVWSSWV
jgi:hypothetical protein